MAEKGIDVLINVSDDGTSGGTMNTLAGIQTTSFSVNTAAIDVTSASSTQRWRSLITGGVRSVSVSGEGVFEDDPAVEDIRNHIMGGAETLSYCQMFIPDFGTAAGAFHVSGFSLTGNHDGEVRFAASFESAGPITWTAAV